jgi:DNA-binding CsgD family transcriptional regulator
LTGDEEQVLQLLAEGRTDKEIAATQGGFARSDPGQVKSLLVKLQVRG